MDRKKVTVLLSSGYTPDKTQLSKFKDKFRFLQKPYTLGDLLQYIKEELQSKFKK